MAVIFEHKKARAATWSRKVACFACLLFLMAAIGHRWGLLETPGFLSVLVLVAVLACLALLFAAVSFQRVWNNGDRGGRDLLVGVGMSLAVLSPFMVSAVLFVRNPPLSDITTDISDPPDLSVAHAAAPAGRGSDDLQAKYYPEITGRRYDLGADHVLAAATSLMEQRGWQAEAPQAVSDIETEIHAVAKTLLLAFPSDVTVRITDEDASTYVDMRSASRFGSHDMGDNARRVASFLNELDDTIAALAVPLPAE